MTPRQSEVAALVVRGLQNKEIARHLGISANVVKDHVRTMRFKIGARNRVELAVKLATIKAMGSAYELPCQDMAYVSEADQPWK